LYQTYAGHIILLKYDFIHFYYVAEKECIPPLKASFNCVVKASFNGYFSGVTGRYAWGFAFTALPIAGLPRQKLFCYFSSITGKFIREGVSSTAINSAMTFWKAHHVEKNIS
jgi:hypothetical protein